MIYSFQAANRNLPGVVIVQQADGKFVKDENGQLLICTQLARAASNLPYFISNGNTPQGIFRIAGTEVSKNAAIGPTPNIQLRMPVEFAADSFFIADRDRQAGAVSYLETYRSLLPESWQFPAMKESYYAGLCGRTEIIAHGTTLSPAYYKNQSFYPCTPTLGCLCCPETWDTATGKLVESDQLKLVNGFLSTPGSDGYLLVVNMDPKLSKEQLKKIVSDYETRFH